MKRDRPIVNSRLEKDWYYVTMGFFAWLRHRDVEVEYEFRNRSKKVRLPDFVDFGRLSEEIEHVKTLRYSEEEVAWLTAKFHHSQPDGFMTDAFAEWLRQSRLSAIDYSVVRLEDGAAEFDIRPRGVWCEAMDWETFVLPILTELYSEALAGQAGVSLDAVVDDAFSRYVLKADELERHPGLLRGSFGLRRQMSKRLSFLIDQHDVNNHPAQLAGISDVSVAKALGVNVIGTFAHQGPMIYSGVCGDGDEDIRASHMQFFDDWSATFSQKWLTAVPDTFGTKSFYQDFGRERAALWPRMKQDSGDPFEEARELLAWYRSMDIDPRTKVFNPTDGLDVPTMIGLHQEFGGQFKSVLPGWGTTRTNDTLLNGAISIVVKAARARLVGGSWRPLAKLSNNLAKASGDPVAISRLKRIHGYDVTSSVECKV